MKWSLKIGRIAGIDLYLHATFLILVAWLAVGEYLARESAAAMLASIGFVLLLFMIIVLHELGHALAARKYGIETRDITLLPIGGVARLEKIPEDPVQELVVAIAGPLVNFVIAGGLFVGILLSGGLGRISHIGWVSGDIPSRLLWLNLWLAGFNLLPAFPMDGGRVLRAFMAMRVGRTRATEVAVSVGHMMALIFGVVGLFGLGSLHSNPFLVFIAFFIWIGADGELQQVRMHELLKGIAASQVMATQFESIRALTPLSEVAAKLVPGFQSEYPVFEGERLVGFVGVEDVARGLAEAGPEAVAGSFVQTSFVMAAPNDSIEEVVADWQPRSGSVVAVMESGRLVGIVTPANIGEHVMLRSALERSPTKAPAPFSSR